MSNAPNVFVIASPAVSGDLDQNFPSRNGVGRVWWQNDTPYGHIVTIDSAQGTGYYVPAFHARLWTQRAPAHTYYYASGSGLSTTLATFAQTPITYAQVEFYDLEDLPGVPDGLFQLGNRMASVGNTVGVNTVIASQLGNADEGIQAVGLPVHGVATSTDQFGPYSTTANANRTLQLGVLINGVYVGLFNLVYDKSASFAGALNVLNNLGLAPYSFQVFGGATGLDGDKITTDGNGNFNALGNLPAVGLGVAAERVKGDGVHITTTTALQTIATLTTPNDGLRHSYRVSARARINNGTSGNNIVLRCAYTDFDANSAVVVWFSGNGGSADVTFGGGTSVLNGVFSCSDRRIDCAPNSAITIQYTDPTNTPNDNVSGTIEQLS